MLHNSLSLLQRTFVCSSQLTVFEQRPIQTNHIGALQILLNGFVKDFQAILYTERPFRTIYVVWLDCYPQCIPQPLTQRMLLIANISHTEYRSNQSGHSLRWES